MAARTKLVYQEDGFLYSYRSKIASISPVSSLPPDDQSLVKNASRDDYALITESTIFYVQGGGQPSDTGTISCVSEANKESNANSDSTPIFEVHSVRHPASGGAILHFGRFKSTIPINPTIFPPGAEIQQNIDIQKRTLHSRLHTAGHILGLAINALSASGVLPSLVESKASHYPDSAAVEFIGLIDGKFKDAIQAKTDEFVKGDSKVLIHWWEMDRLLKECKGVEEGFVLPEGETLGRVVEMEGLGSYPCGGTHVASCSQVGRVEVKKIARSKGVSRISYRVV